MILASPSRLDGPLRHRLESALKGVESPFSAKPETLNGTPHGRDRDINFKLVAQHLSQLPLRAVGDVDQRFLEQLQCRLGELSAARDGDTSRRWCNVSLALPSQPTTDAGTAYLEPPRELRVGPLTVVMGFYNTASERDGMGAGHRNLQEEITRSAHGINTFAGLSKTALSSYLSSSAVGGFGHDLAQISVRLGPAPTMTHNVLFLEATGDERYSGVHIGGGTSIVVLPIDGDGEIDLPEVEYKSTLVHEMAHWYFHESLRFDGDTIWIQEGLATLVEVDIYPDGSSSEKLQEGFESLYTDLLSFDRMDALSKYKQEDGYTIGSFVLSQALWLSHARGIGSSSFWQMLESFVTNAGYGGVLDSAGLKAGFDSLLPSDPSLPTPRLSFYDEWIARSTFGLPLLGFTEKAEDGSGGWTLRVEQVQVSMDPLWMPYTNVPYGLGCGSADDMAVRPFSECVANGTFDVLDYTQASEVKEVYVDHVLTSVPTSSTETPMVGLFRLGNLRPSSSVGNADFRQTTTSVIYFLLCEAGSTASECVDDRDIDGQPYANDCDYGNALVFPFQKAAGESPSVGSIDYNCDGWVF